MTIYTTQLGAGLGMIPETLILLDLWQVGMSGQQLNQAALESGRFPNMSARRLRNFVAECFVPRYLRSNAKPALLIQRLRDVMARRELEQLMFICTCRANPILADFVRDVYWNHYASGRQVISNDDARAFVIRAKQEGRTTTAWSENLVRRVSAYLTGCCADFGLLDSSTKGTRTILSYRLESLVAIVLAYDLHFAGNGDNKIINHPDWALFGLEPRDVLDELKRLSLQGHFIIQHAGGVTQISWQWNNMEEVVNVIAGR